MKIDSNAKRKPCEACQGVGFHRDRWDMCRKCHGLGDVPQTGLDVTMGVAGIREDRQAPDCR